jgi:CDP-diacylglycerol--serine O-phosphatidyltransferase
MLYCWGICTPVDQIVLIFYVLCGLTRLARFNIVQSLVQKNALGRASYIEGLPAPYAALVVSTTVAICVWTGEDPGAPFLDSIFADTFYEMHLALVPVAILGAAMASKRLKFSFDGTWSVLITIAAVFMGCTWKFSI